MYRTTTAAGWGDGKVLCLKSSEEVGTGTSTGLAGQLGNSWPARISLESKQTNKSGRYVEVMTLEIVLMHTNTGVPSHTPANTRMHAYMQCLT